MAKREWIGEYVLYISYNKPHTNEVITQSISLGKCLGEDEAKDKAIVTLLRDFSGVCPTEVYICDGWGHLIYMR